MHTVAPDAAAQPGLSASTRRWIQRAAALAERNPALDPGVYRLGAIVVRGGSVLATGVNRHRNAQVFGQRQNPPIPRSAWSFCAEQVCLRGVHEAHGATLYVARVTPGGRVAMARPCRSCATLAAAAGIVKVAYTTEAGGVRLARLEQLLGEPLRDYERLALRASA